MEKNNGDTYYGYFLNSFQGNKWEKLPGAERVFLLKGIETVIHLVQLGDPSWNPCWVGKRVWVVTEVSSGGTIVCGKTRKEALEEARKILEGVGREEMKEKLSALDHIQTNPRFLHGGLKLR